MAPTQEHVTSSFIDTKSDEKRSTLSSPSSVRGNSSSSSITVDCKISKGRSSSSNSSSSSSSNNSSSNSSTTNRSKDSSSSSSSSSNNSNINSMLCEPDVSQKESTGVREALLPITCRGHFYHDTCFKEARQHFDAAVRDVLDHWGERSTLVDDLTAYRKLRETNLTEDNQAVTVSEDDNSHQVVIDVRDFVSGDVKVKVIDENELVVEGGVEQRQEGSVSKKSFKRRFSFPGLVRLEAVTSTMSSDGVLTVTVPKKTVQLTDRKKVDMREMNTTTNSSTVKQTGEKSNMHVNTAHHNIKPKSSTKSMLIENTENQSKKSTQFIANNEVTKTSDKTTETSGSTSADASLHQTSDSVLPISHRGLFFHDSFFTEARQDFEAAMKNVLNTWGETPVSDHLTCYRSLRERDLKEENQAVSVTEDHQSHKVVMDVRDFVSGDVKVKVVDEDELVIEGSVEQRQEGSLSNKSFRRRFSFPGLVRPEAVTSTMSSDGVLTVTVPKKEPSKSKNSISVADNISCTSPLQSARNTSSSSVTSNIKYHEQRTSSTKMADVRRSSIVETDKTRKTSTSSSCDLSLGDNSLSHEAQGTTPKDKSAINEESGLLDSFLPISHKGLFFHDSFFQDVREHFETAVKEVLTKMGQMKSPVDDLSLYRSLRECDLRDENQALKVTEDDHSHQVVIDVRDFMTGDVKVKAVDKNEIVVEGRVEKQEGDYKSHKSFCRRFNLPGVVDLDAITSAISSDGVLTIRAPKTSGNTSVRMSSQGVRTQRHQVTSGTSCSGQQESSSEESEQRDGYSCSTFTHSSTSHQHFVSSNM